LATPLAFNPIDGAVPYIIIIVSDISLKTRNSGYISVIDSLGISSTTFTHCDPKAIELAEITPNNGNYAVQGHSRSPILVPTNRKLICLTPPAEGFPWDDLLKISVDVNG